jgi:phage repressor protein C with HTH and peptisase S24 domain
VVRTTTGEILAKQLTRRSARRVELKSLNPTHPDRSLDLKDVAWIHRIVWASH